ncbi:hypothetical protein TNCV_111161 [Trichonephila clavipes]|nr:hypothetical protein TNCV_111161 [Trichonephila clavipes]
MSLWSPLTQQNVPGTTSEGSATTRVTPLVAPTEPTRFHRNCRNTTIDIAICKGPMGSMRSTGGQSRLVCGLVRAHFKKIRAIRR